MKQRRNPYSTGAIPAVYQDLSTSNDKPVKKAIVDLPKRWKEIQNALPDTNMGAVTFMWKHSILPSLVANYDFQYIGIGQFVESREDLFASDYL